MKKNIYGIVMTIAVIILFLPVGLHAEEDSPEEDVILARLFKDVRPREEVFFANFGPKAGILIPNSSAFRQIYGSAIFSYGLYFNVWFEDLGAKFEVEQSFSERLFPLNEIDKWKNVHSTLTLTPISLSIQKKFGIFSKWNFYLGAGACGMIAKERFRGESYVKDSATGAYDYKYVDFFSVDTVWGLQFFMGLFKKSHVGFEIRYSYIPPSSDAGFRDMGSLSAAVIWSF